MVEKSDSDQSRIITELDSVREFRISLEKNVQELMERFREKREEENEMKEHFKNFLTAQVSKFELSKMLYEKRGRILRFQVFSSPSNLAIFGPNTACKLEK